MPRKGKKKDEVYLDYGESKPKYENSSTTSASNDTVFYTFIAFIV